MLCVNLELSQAAFKLLSPSVLEMGIQPKTQQNLKMYKLLSLVCLLSTKSLKSLKRKYIIVSLGFKAGLSIFIYIFVIQSFGMLLPMTKKMFVIVFCVGFDNCSHILFVGLKCFYIVYELCLFIMCDDEYRG